MEAQDSLPEVLELLSQQEQPVLLLLPANTFRAEHFLALRSFLRTSKHPPFLLVIPPQRSQETTLAIRHGVAYASSIEDALRTLAIVSQREEMDPSSQVTNTKRHRITETLPQVEEPSLQNASTLVSTTRKRPALNAGVIIALLLLSLIAVPLLLLPPFPTTPKTSPAAAPVGVLAFMSSGQFDPSTTRGYNDIITMSLRSLPAPDRGRFYYIWLLPDSGDDTTPPLLIGSLHTGGPINIIYSSPTHINLLASYSGVRITVQSSKNAPAIPSQNPADWRWQGIFPNTPTPGDENHYSLLSHLRHLLARDPTLQANQIPGGLAIWLTRNVSKVEEWASAAQGDWHSAQTDVSQIHNQMLRILEYLDGEFYYTRDVPTGSVWLVDPQAGKIGLLDRVPNQNPPGFLVHVDIHLTGLAEAPGHTLQQKQLAILVDTVIQRMSADLLQVRTDAAKLVNMNAQQIRKQGNEAILNDIVMLTSETNSGWFDPHTGENVGGGVWLASRLQQLATISVSSV